MRPIPALIAIAAVAGAGDITVAGHANAQCSVFNRHPCMPTVCSVFRRRPCVPEIDYPLGENLQLTIDSAAAEHATDGPDRNAGSDEAAGTTGAAHKLNTIRDLFAALRGCWVPPPEDQERPGMQMSVRLSFKRTGEMIGPPRVTYTSPDAPSETRNVYHDAITVALDRCTPLPFSAGLGGALAGRPIAIRFVDDRDRK
jgi:hypothetical protein